MAQLSSKQRAKALKKHNLGHAAAVPQNCQPKPKPNILSNKLDNIIPEGISEPLWNDFKMLRKSKKAPITETAMNGIKKQAGLAGITFKEALEICCQNGWAGFKAEWINKTKGNLNGQSKHERAQAALDRAEAIINGQVEANPLLSITKL